MKEIRKFFVGAVVLACTMGVTSCTHNETKSYEVKFYDDTTVLKTEKVKDGETATNWTPTKEGFEFVDWYATPNFKFAYKFEPVHQNTSVYALFQSTQVVEDTRSWAIVGSGTSKVLSTSGFGNTINAEHLLTKADKKNEFSITLDLEVGDEFQFAINSSWANQRGGGYLETTSKDGTEYFEVKGSHLSTNTKKCNIGVLVSGNYTLTLSTNPGDDYYDTKDAYYTEENKESFNYNDFDKITWVRNGDVLSQPVKTIDVYYKLSSNNDWEPVLIDSILSNAEVKVTLKLEEGDKLCFVYTDNGQKINAVYPGNLIRYTAIGEAKDDNANANFSTNADYNFVCDVAGKYEFTIDYSTGTPVVNTTLIPEATSYEVIIKGSMTGWANSDRIASEGDVVTFNYTFAEGDEFGFAWFDATTTTSYGNWIGTSCLGTEGDANSVFSGENNFKCTQAGTYTIKITKTSDGTVSVNFYNI